MHVISRKRLADFWKTHPRAEGPLKAWHQVVERAKWKCFGDIKQTYHSADLVGKCVVFNLGGNKFRLVVTVAFKYKRVYIRSVMTHAEYNKENGRTNAYAQTKSAKRSG